MPGPCAFHSKSTAATSPLARACTSPPTGTRPACASSSLPAPAGVSATRSVPVYSASATIESYLTRSAMAGDAYSVQLSPLPSSRAKRSPLTLLALPSPGAVPSTLRTPPLANFSSGVTRVYSAVAYGEPRTSGTSKWPLPADQRTVTESMSCLKILRPLGSSCAPSETTSATGRMTKSTDLTLSSERGSETCSPSGSARARYGIG